MRHQKAGKKLNRTGSHRNAMFRNMVTSLLEHGRIRTTDAKAKELRRWADHMITLAKRGDLHARRQALSVIRDKAVAHKLFEDAQERFGDRAGGYTRLIKVGRRSGDAAPVSLVELVTAKAEKKDKKKKSKVSKKPSVKAKKEAPAKPEKEKPAEAETDHKETEQTEPEPDKDSISEPEAPSRQEETSSDGSDSSGAETDEAAEDRQSEEEAKQ